jgi:hypothetical protein
MPLLFLLNALDQILETFIFYFKSFNNKPVLFVEEITSEFEYDFLFVFDDGKEKRVKIRIDDTFLPNM